MPHPPGGLLCFLAHDVVTWGHSLYLALDNLTVLPDVKLPESRLRKKTSDLCQEVQSECPDAYAGDWRSSTWRPTPGLCLEIIYMETNSRTVIGDHLHGDQHQDCDWGSSTRRPTPGLRSTLPRTSSACAVGYKMFLEKPKTKM